MKGGGFEGGERVGGVGGGGGGGNEGLEGLSSVSLFWSCAYLVCQVPKLN
jgi:hypothetical protein